jgi:hypothetical protein
MKAALLLVTLALIGAPVADAATSTRQAAPVVRPAQAPAQAKSTTSTSTSTSTATVKPTTDQTRTVRPSSAAPSGIGR